MNVYDTDKGFERIDLSGYGSSTGMFRLVQQSPAIGSSPQPGASFLWVGEHHHLDREQVTRLVTHLQHWLKTGHLDFSRQTEIYEKFAVLSASTTANSFGLRGMLIVSESGRAYEVMANSLSEKAEGDRFSVKMINGEPQFAWLGFECSAEKTLNEYGTVRYRYLFPEESKKESG